MCGIAGVYHVAGAATAEPALVRRMAAVQAHRGPDDEGTYVDGPVALGHRRLSIIDIAGGHQPMLSDDRTTAIVFNGEIYNFRELRRALERDGHRFRTDTDTEVILRAYEAYGEACVERLRGMFAFAIWDRSAGRLLLARDRLGIKPLYYGWDGRTLRFASEIKAILEDPEVARTIDPTALDDYLTYLYIPAPKTIFQRIRKLRPGHTLAVSADGLVERRYWDLAFEPVESGTEADHAAGLLEKLRESVALHLVSDVPLGAFLSGGIDSSAVVGLMAGLVSRPVDTASVGFTENGFDELPYARLAADRFGTSPHEAVVEADAAGILDALVWHYDEPFADSSMIPTYYVSRVARERVVVCLSGDGGDENFAGYRRYRFDALEHRIRRAVPRPVGRPLFGAIGRLYPKADWLPRPLRAKTLLTNLAAAPERAYFRSVSWFDPSMKRALYREPLRRALGGYDPFGVLEAHFDRTRGWDPLSRVQYVDIKTYLPDDILAKVDRASMAHSLEVRVPLLDHEVVEHAARIPARYKLSGGEGKRVLKAALSGIVPDEILHRPKMGFSIPLGEWLRGPLGPLFEGRVLAPDAFVRSLLDTAQVERWWARHRRRTRDYSHHLFALLVLECWGRRFVEGRP